MSKFNTVWITGGAGFIGSNAASRFLKLGSKVVVFDNLSRNGTEKNLNWLESFKGNLCFEKSDIRDQEKVYGSIKLHKPDLILHEAAQVAVTTSVVDPRNDMNINILGTFNVLDAIRLHSPESIFINASTNKVYGHLDQFKVDENPLRYFLTEGNGVTENTPLDFFSPYGCSKGAADQYTIDFARLYNLKTVSLRQSCIYGYRQLGIEDQGWVAWFIIASVLGKKITVYGNGKQVRDLLFIDDLIDCYSMAAESIQVTSGKAYNIGGGPSNSLSLLEFFEVIKDISGKPLEFSKGSWRPGDQPLYISDVSKAKKDFGWSPKTKVIDGIEKLYRWVNDNKSLFESL